MIFIAIKENIEDTMEKPANFLWLIMIIIVVRVGQLVVLDELLHETTICWIMVSVSRLSCRIMLINYTV